MKHELYYSASYPQAQASSPFAFMKKIKFLFVLILAILGVVAYFNMEFVDKIINSIKHNTKLTSRESYVQTKDSIPPQVTIEPVETIQPIKANNFTQEELQSIANEIVKSLKIIKLEKEAFTTENSQTSQSNTQESEVQIQKIQTQEIQQSNENTPSKEIKTLPTPPIIKHSNLNKTHTIQVESSLTTSPPQEGIPYHKEVSVESIEEPIIEKNSLPSKDILKTLSVELNNAVEVSVQSAPEGIPFIKSEEIYDDTYLEEEIINEETVDELLY
jgi:hypothetical protein